MIKFKEYSNQSWFVDKTKVRTDYVVIENLKQFIADEPPSIHPDHPIYINFWSKETKKCIEGIWGKEFGGYRYMPGNLYFFGSYGIIEHSWEDERGVKVTEDIKPKIVDYLWDFAYSSWVCYGFSGFSKDDEYNCHNSLKDFYDGKLEKKYLPKQCINKKGEAKLYKNPYEYIKEIKSKNLGKPLFSNPTKNNNILGSRGGTKSYWAAIGELEYNFVFGGARRYDQKFINGEYKSSQCVGAGDTNKSSEMLNKLLASQAAKANSEQDKFKKWFGIWTEIDSKGDEVVYPCPFHKKTLGNLDCPNKKPNKIFRAKYKVDINGRWEERGTGSSIAHVNYSTKKGDGFRAAEGGRYLFTDVEEVGSLENYVEVLGANEGTTSRGGLKFGVQWAQGTSGHIEYIQAAKKVFLNPGDYECLEFETVFNKTPTGYFIPYYITLFKFKDANGNTDYDGAINYVNEQRLALSKSKDPKPLRDFMMNKPCYIDEMWVTDKGFYLPYEEASAREKQLMEFDLYRSLMTNVELYWDDNGPYNGVNYNVLHDAEPYIAFPHEHGKKSDPSGNVVIYEWPEANAPSDMYMFVGHDPYVEEDIEKGGSVGATHVLKNPKYIGQGYTGNVLVATYIGKPIKGLEYYYGQQERLLQMYGNPTRGLWFEKNRGDACREYYIRKNKVNLLALTPQRTQGSSIQQKNILSYGYLVGNKISKIQQAKMLNDWLLEETEFNINGVVEKKKNIFRIPCLYTIRQIMQYDIDENFDAVDSLRGSVIGLREYENTLSEYAHKKQKDKIFKGLLKNSRIFKHANNARRTITGA